LPITFAILSHTSMMSISSGWFFVVLSESIFFANNHIVLPGLGSYIGKAILEANFTAISYSIFAMFCVILLHDQLFFRPLLVWSEKFKFFIDNNAPYYSSWFYNLFNECNLLKKIDFYYIFMKFFMNVNFIFFLKIKNKFKLEGFYTFVKIVIFCFLLFLIYFFLKNIIIFEIINVFYLCTLTGIKVVLLIFLASLVWVPVGVFIGLNKKLSFFLQPIIQFLAAFPANFFYPLIIILILSYKLNHDFWTMPLMILGTQWYILFNVIAGANSISTDLYYVSLNFGLTGYNLWKRLFLPSIFPNYVTGVVTAAGGCWNASIVAEFVQWGNDTIISTGIGSYISNCTMLGDFSRIFLGIFVMSLYVLFLNRFLWKRLYNFSAEKFLVN
ncbi:MAG: ABC transporter permease subunit, partial [Deltaproteobacteria bacterium]